jgi:hypothetical protein
LGQSDTPETPRAREAQLEEAVSVLDKSAPQPRRWNQHRRPNRVRTVGLDPLQIRDAAGRLGLAGSGTEGFKWPRGQS